MKKTISINIGGSIFYIEDDAFVVLDEYLKSIKNHFAADPNKDEIISDMESRMAEQFLSGKDKLKDKIVTLDEVQKLIKSMGRVEDFDSGAEQPEKTEETKSGKRLFRDEQNGMVGGVSSGLGAYFGVDPILFRLLFVLITLSGGAGVVIYIIMWVLTPSAQTAEQKSQMRGQGVDLSGIQKTVKDRINDAKNSNFFKRFFVGLGRLIRLLFTIIVKFIGVVVTFATTVSIVATTFAFAVALFNRNSEYMDLPLSQIVTGWQYVGLLLLAFAIVIIPLYLMLMLGISLVRGKSTIKVAMIIGLAVAWFVFLMTGGVVASRFGPELKARYESLPQVQQVSEIYEISDFTKLAVSSAVRVNIKQGKDYSVVAHGRQIDMESFQVEKFEDALKMRQDSRNHFCFICWDEPVTVDITMPQLTSVIADGAVRIESAEFATKDFEVNLDGASRLNMGLKLTGTLTAGMDGASRATLFGTAPTVVLKIDGASSFNGIELVGKSADIDADGATRARINSSDLLKVKADGASRIFYVGAPRIEQDLDGAARVINIDEDGDYFIENLKAPLTPKPPLAPIEP